MELGIIGLGRMGGNLALQSVEKNIKIVGKARGTKPELTEKGVTVVTSYKEFTEFLETPRVVFLSLPAGSTVDTVTAELLPFLTKGDVILDGGNSYFKDSIRREADLSKKGIQFIDCGISGGIEGARHGACFMIGGQPQAAKLCEPILKALAVEGGYLYCGGPGSGHYVKLVHNGIEYGMLQAIGEGVELLEHSDFALNLQDVFQVWSHGSVIRSWLIELLKEGTLETGNIQKTPSFVEDTGEVNWLVEEAIEKEIPTPIITQSVIELFKYRQSESNAGRAIAIMRHGFGGHPYGKDEKVARERKTGRLRQI